MSLAQKAAILMPSSTSLRTVGLDSTVHFPSSSADLLNCSHFLYLYTVIISLLSTFLEKAGVWKELCIVWSVDITVRLVLRWRIAYVEVAIAVRFRIPHIFTSTHLSWHIVVRLTLTVALSLPWNKGSHLRGFVPCASSLNHCRFVDLSLFHRQCFCIRD
jgi:hypothetical protein